MRRSVRRGTCVLGLTALMLAVPAGALASPKFTAKSEVQAIVRVHNTFGDLFQGFYANTLTEQQTWCDNIRSDQEPDWSSYDHDVAQDELLTKDFAGYNKDVQKWIATLEKFRPPKAKKSARKLFDKAVGVLRQAHTEHAKEIFNLAGGFAHLQAHDCDPVTTDRSDAAAPGRLAWGDEHVALHDFTVVFKVKVSDLNWPPGATPYDQSS